MKPKKAFRKWWKRAGKTKARIFIVEFVAQAAFMAGYRLGRNK